MFRYTQETVTNEISYTFGHSGCGGYFTLYDYAKDIKNELEKIPGVREVGIAGGDQREIGIDYSPEKLNYYGISIAQANAAVQSANVSIPSGNFDGEKYVLHTIPSGIFFFTFFLFRALARFAPAIVLPFHY